MKAPAWSRLLFTVSRTLSVIDRTHQIVRDELLFAFLTPAQRSALTFYVYERTNSYLDGGDLFSHGLFAWELELLDDARVPRSGRVLLGAAGGGRELLGLEKRGYDVVAFEPVLPLVNSARQVARRPSTVVLQASYHDLVEYVRGRRGGPLDDLKPPFELCVLGWASLSHLTGLGEAVETLRAIRAIAPRAPVITSFFLRVEAGSPTRGGARKLRGAVRRALAKVRREEVPEGLEFFTHGGFTHAFSRDELFQICENAGYRVGYFSQSDYPHALLLPVDNGEGSAHGDS